MRSSSSIAGRRNFLKNMGLGGLFYTARGAFAQALTLTPSLTIGPYYPNRLPLDLDNDLLVINDAITPAIGTISWVRGRVFDRIGAPVRNALVEIWQADNNGAYIHTSSPIANRDSNFQGYGKFLTGSSGEYLFRTVKPGLYPGRTRHIHFQITAPGSSGFTTQLFVDGDSLNASDGVLNGVRDAAQRAMIVPAWTKLANSATGDLDVKFDIYLGFTPSDSATASRPTIFALGGIVNAADSQAGVASGSWVTLHGANLSTTTRTWTAADIVEGKLPRALDGVSVKIDGKDASVYFISPTQLNVQAPAVSNATSAQVTVTNSSGTSAAATTTLAAFQPSFFTLGGEYVAAVRADGSTIAPTGLIEGLATVPAKPNEQILLFGTGFGPASPEVPAGQTLESSTTLANRVRIHMDAAEAIVSFAGLIGPGLYQFNVTVPDLPDGEHSITAQVAGIRTVKLARLSVLRA